MSNSSGNGDNTIQFNRFKKEEDKEKEELQHLEKTQAHEVISKSEGFLAIGLDKEGDLQFIEGGSFNTLKMLGALKLMEKYLADAVMDDL